MSITEKTAARPRVAPYIVIKSQSHLRELVKDLEAQGFSGHNTEDRLLYSKLEKMVRAANVLKMKVEENHLIERLSLKKLDTYEEIKAKLDGHFGQFSQEDKIMELVGGLTLVMGDQIRRPAKNYPGPFDQRKWDEGCKKWGMTEETAPMDHEGNKADTVYVYDLRPTKLLKVKTDSINNLGTLLTMVYGEGYNIQTKFHNNGNIDLKGDVDKLRLLLIKKYEGKAYYFIVK